LITEQKRYPMTWAKIEAVAASPNGFETITPQSARELLAERDARCVEWEQLAEERHRDILELTTDNTKQRRAAEDATATLERVREALRGYPQMGCRVAVEAALAGQPEAPKGQGAKPLPAREHARRRGSLDGADAQALEGALSQVERDLAAANARIAEQAELIGVLRESEGRWITVAESEEAEKDAANARADAAERDLKATRDDKQVWINRWYERGGKLLELGDERDQLAARVKELERSLEKAFELSESASEAYLQLRDERDELAKRCAK
jgi:hypothetical protein